MPIDNAGDNTGNADDEEKRQSSEDGGCDDLGGRMDVVVGDREELGYAVDKI